MPVVSYHFLAVLVIILEIFQVTVAVFSLGNGVNLQPAYYCNGDQNLGWSTMKSSSPKIKAVRIELEQQSSADMNDFARWLKEARANNYTTVATYHLYTQLGSNDPQVVINAAKWWQSNYQNLVKQAGGPFYINLINEWGDHTLSSSAYADAYNQAIAIVRTVYSDYIICDIPGWGQEFVKASKASPLIKDQKIVFSGHVYPAAWDSSTGTPTTSNLDTLAATGRPCMLGEFGSKGSGSADWSALVDHAKALKWPVLGWAWNGDGGDMNMVSPSWSSSCSATSYSTSNSYYSTVYNKL